MQGKRAGRRIPFCHRNASRKHLGERDAATLALGKSQSNESDAYPERIRGQPIDGRSANNAVSTAPSAQLASTEIVGYRQAVAARGSCDRHFAARCPFNLATSAAPLMTGIVVWLYFAQPNKDPFGLVIVGWGIIVWLGGRAIRYLLNKQ